MGLATFLLGDVSSFSRFASSIDNAGERQKRWFFYGQDTFRVTRKLVLNYGLRWEIYFPQSVTGKGAGGWVDLDTGLVNVAGFGNVNLQGNVNHNFTNFAPRLGIAYQATLQDSGPVGLRPQLRLGVFGSIFGHTATQNLPVLVAQQLNPSSITGSVFDLSKGPPAPPFPKVPPSGQFRLPDQVGAFVLPRRMRLPTLDAWNVTVQQEITPTLSLSAGYVANKGTHVFAGDYRLTMIPISQPSLDSEASIRTSENLSLRNSDGRSNSNILATMLPTITTRCKWWRTSASPGDISFSLTTRGPRPWATTPTTTQSIQSLTTVSPTRTASMFLS